VKLGASHGAELGVLFGTNVLKGRGLPSIAEYQLGNLMRSVWAAFARDPVHGLEKFNWPQYDPSSELIFKDTSSTRIELME